MYFLLKALFCSSFAAPFHGFAFWFDVEFGTSLVNTSKSNNAQPALLAAPDDTATETDKTKKRANPSEGLVLSTAPEAPPTHWQQVSHLSYTFFSSYHANSC